MVLSSSQAKLFDACHRLLPATSTSSSRPPPTSLSRSWPRQPPPWAWPWAWEDGEQGRRRSRSRGTSKEQALGLPARYCGRLQQQQQQSPRAHQQQGEDGDQQQVLQEGSGIMCEPCNGRGWLPCDFCKGQKTNVKAENNRIYRRCPSCRAIGYVLCSNCKVFKCVTFPDYGDGEMRLMNPSVGAVDRCNRIESIARDPDSVTAIASWFV